MHGVCKGREQVSVCFPVKLRLRQGYILSPCLFNVDMNGVVREVDANVLGKRHEVVVSMSSELTVESVAFFFS